jgi:hypothetical protein
MQFLLQVRSKNRKGRHVPPLILVVLAFFIVFKTLFILQLLENISQLVFSVTFFLITSLTNHFLMNTYFR